MIYVYIALIVLGLILRKPRLMCWLITLFLGILTATSVYVPDFEAYSNIYYLIDKNMLYETGYGWYILNDLGRELNLTYPEFKGWLAFFCLILIIITIHYFLGKNYNVIWGLYLLYPSLIDMIQIRFFTAMSIVLFGLIFLSKNKLWSIVTYIALVLVATSIHSAASFYLIFIFMYLIGEHKKIFSYIIVLFSFFMIPLGSKLKGVISYFANTRELSYFEKPAEMSHVFIYFIIIIIFFLLTNHMNNQIQSEKTFSKREKSFSEFLVKFNLCMLFILPILPMSFDFIRVQRIAWILLYMLFAIFSANNTPIRFGNVLVNSKLLGIIFALFGFCVMLLYFAPLVVSGFFD